LALGAAFTLATLAGAFAFAGALADAFAIADALAGALAGAFATADGFAGLVALASFLASIFPMRTSLALARLSASPLSRPATSPSRILEMTSVILAVDY